MFETTYYFVNRKSEMKNDLFDFVLKVFKCKCIAAFVLVLKLLFYESERKNMSDVLSFLFGTQNMSSASSYGNKMRVQFQKNEN